jgi:ATP-dependent Lon protease
VNLKDLEDIPVEAKKQLQIRPVENIDEVLTIALIKPEPQHS